METNDKVWLVERGDYSDYNVEAIFSTEEAAKELSAHMEGSTVREYVLDHWVPAKATFQFTFDLDGNIQKVEENPWVKDDFAPPQGYKADFTRFWMSSEGISHVYVPRGPVELAQKIACDYFMRCRVFIEQAKDLLDRSGIVSNHKAQYPGMGDYYPWSVVSDIAQVLAGTVAAPTLPGSTHEGWVAQALGIRDIHNV